MNEPLQVTSEGVYKTREGEIVDVLDFGTSERPYFRAYWWGGWYNVNPETDVLLDAESRKIETVQHEREMECVERLGDLERNKNRARLPK
jgi:hypothetical protein